MTEGPGTVRSWASHQSYILGVSAPRERTLLGPLRTWEAFRKLLEPFLALLPTGLQDEYGFEFWTRVVKGAVTTPPQECPEGKKTTWYPIYA